MGEGISRKIIGKPDSEAGFNIQLAKAKGGGQKEIIDTKKEVPTSGDSVLTWALSEWALGFGIHKELWFDRDHNP